MRIYYNSEASTLHIDEGSKSTTLDIPEEFNAKEMRIFMQSETLYAIIQQITGGDDY